MKYLIFAAVTAALPLLPEAVAKPFPEFTSDEQDRLRGGEILVWGEKAERKRFIHSAVLLEHPVGQVWALLDDKEAAPTYITGVRSARILSREENVIDIAQETEAPGTGRTFSYTIRHTTTFPHRVDFVRLSGHLRHIEGAWIFEPVDEGAKTLLVYQLHLDAGMLVPQSFVSSSQMKAVPEIMASIRRALSEQAWPTLPSLPLAAGRPTEAIVPAAVALPAAVAIP